MSHRYLYFKCPPFPSFISSGKEFFKPGDTHVERVFSTFVAMFIDRGIVYFTEGEKEYELKEGEWFIQTPGIRHYGHKASIHPASYYWIHFMPADHWDIVLQELGNNGLKVEDTGEGIRSPVYQVCMPMRHTCPVGEWGTLLETINSAHRSAAGYVAAQSHFIQLLGMMVSSGAGPHPTGREALSYEVQEYIRNHYMNRITVKSIAQSLHFSPDYITRCFKGSYGVTPSDFIIHTQMDHAKNMLACTSKPIMSIAGELGYGDIAAFSRVFRKTQGISPSCYRKRSWGK